MKKSKSIPTHGGPRDGAGRPPIGKSAMIRKQVMLDAETIKHAEKIGDGNLSAGLRTAITWARLLGRVR